jgi:hypothetical protein
VDENDVRIMADNKLACPVNRRLCLRISLLKFYFALNLTYEKLQLLSEEQICSRREEQRRRNFLFLRAASCCVQFLQFLKVPSIATMFFNSISFATTCLGPYRPFSGGTYTSHFLARLTIVRD